MKREIDKERDREREREIGKEYKERERRKSKKRNRGRILASNNGSTKMSVSEDGQSAEMSNSELASVG